MAYSNQFALTVELTRLLPALGKVTNKAANAMINHARDLRHSGSDIVVEKDLADIFGRCTISSALSSTFKTVITQSSSNISLLEGIMFQGGPGPTVSRAFQDPPYFAMVVQLSLLVWTFRAGYLATAISEALRRRSEGAPPSHILQSNPDRQGILGVLRACESQTSEFNWNMMLNAVSTTLGYETEKAPIDFSDSILQGLLDMLPMVQTLPIDRLIHIRIPVGQGSESGVTTLVVWAHHVLDLTVLVRTGKREGQPIKDIRFGGSEIEQVFIEEINADDKAAVILLDSQNEQLLSIKPEPDSEFDLIGAVRRVPAKGWGNALLADNLEGYMTFRTQSRAVIEELQVVTSAFALLIAGHLVKDDSGREMDVGTDKRRSKIVYDIGEAPLIQASRFLFDNPRINYGDVKSFANSYASRPLDGSLPLPSALDAASRSPPHVKDHTTVVNSEWHIICEHARHLAIFLIALAHVVKLEDCEDLMFVGLAFGAMSEHPLAQQLEEWNGTESLDISDDAWLQAIAIPLLSHKETISKLPWDKVCLISDRGWSAWITTFGELDPAYTEAGLVNIRRGSPCRNGVWKIGIWDFARGSPEYMTDPERAESCGQSASLRCAEKITMETPYCGEGEDVFVVSARFRMHRPIPKQRRVQLIGYKELQKYLWCVQLSRRCPHGSRNYEEIKLAVGSATIAGFGNYLHEIEERILICLTAHSVGARWLALTNIPWITPTSEVEDGAPWRQILLRRDDCCFQCVVDQAATQAGKWFIIL